MLTPIICPIFSEKILPSRPIASNELEFETLSLNMVCFIIASSFRNLIYNNVWNWNISNIWKEMYRYRYHFGVMINHVSTFLSNTYSFFASGVYFVHIKFNFTLLNLIRFETFKYNAAVNTAFKMFSLFKEGFTISKEKYKMNNFRKSYS